MEYASPVWEPSTQVDINRVEMVQHRVTRYVCNRYNNRSSVSDMLMELQWPSMQERRKNARLIMMYRLANGLTRVNVENRLVTPNRLSRDIHQHSFQTMSPGVRHG